MTALPSALPFVAFMIRPTRAPIAFSSPAQYFAQARDRRRSPRRPRLTSAESSMASKPLAAAMAAGSPPLFATRSATSSRAWVAVSLPGHLEPGQRGQVGRRARPLRPRSSAKASAGRGPAPASGRRPRRSPRARSRRARVRPRASPARCRRANRWPRPVGAGERPAAAAGRRGPPRSTRRSAPAARGRARGSSGSRRRLPSCATCGCGRRSRPSAGSAGAPTSPALDADRPGGAPRTRWPARATARELTFLISHRVPNGVPGLCTADVGVDPHRALLHLGVGRRRRRRGCARSSVTYWRASSGVRMSGRQTISTSGTPARLKSISE